MIEIKFDKEKKQSLAYDSNVKIGECDYIESEDGWNIIHTEVSNLYQGQGIARRLVESIIENGTWAPTAAKAMKDIIMTMKNIDLCEIVVTIKSKLNVTSREQMNNLVTEILN